MSHWNYQELDVLQKQAVQRLITAELELMAAKAVLSEIETKIVIDYLWDNCGVVLHEGVCTFNGCPDKPMDVVVEKIHPLSGTHNDHVVIEYRPFTTRGKPSKTTMLTTFECLVYFTKKTATNQE